MVILHTAVYIGFPWRPASHHCSRGLKSVRDTEEKKVFSYAADSEKGLCLRCAGTQIQAVLTKDYDLLGKLGIIGLV